MSGREREPAPSAGPGWGGLSTVLALGALAGAGCGPTNEQAGVAVALVSPLVLAIEAVFFTLLRKLWQRALSEAIAPPIPGWLALLGVLAAVAGVAALVGPAGEAVEWLVLALWAYGTSHFAVALVVWRIWLAVRARDAFVGGPAVAFALLLLPALPLAAGAQPGQDSFAFALWLYPGYAGWVPGVLLLLAFVEAGIRASVAAKRRARPGDPAGPTA